jgi:hypothetical protein
MSGAFGMRNAYDSMGREHRVDLVINAMLMFKRILRNRSQKCRIVIFRDFPKSDLTNAGIVP